MCKSVPDTYFTNRQLKVNLPDGFERPNKINWILVAKLYWERGLSQADSMYWGGCAAGNAKGNPSTLHENKIVRAYLEGAACTESIRMAEILRIQGINKQLRKHLFDNLGELMPGRIREYRENSKHLCSIAGIELILKLRGDKNAPLEHNHTGNLAVRFRNDSDGDTGDSE